MSDTTGHAIDALFVEERRYPPPPDFAAQANAQPDIYDRDPDEFWETEARTRVSWFKPFETLYEWDLPYAKWFLGGTLNACYNCVDRHVEDGNGDRVAYHWEGEPEGDLLTITFADLQKRVVRAANALKSLGVERGTPVAVYMGMVPELPVTMLALSRLGAPFTVVFGGFSADALSDRMNDMECRVLVTQDGGYRRGAVVPLKANADAAALKSPAVERVLVVRRTADDVAMDPDRDVWWHELVDEQSDDPASSICCTRAGRRRSRKGSCTRPAGTWSARPRPITTSST
jgi:acetyl-CoA synthetase